MDVALISYNFTLILGIQLWVWLGLGVGDWVKSIYLDVVYLYLEQKMLIQEHVLLRMFSYLYS